MKDIAVRFDVLDAHITSWMARHGLPLLRISLGIVFLWLSNIFLHDIRHWGQIATVLRQSGFTNQWAHDMLLTGVKL